MNLWQWWVAFNDQYSAQIRGAILLLAIAYCVLMILERWMKK